MNTEELPLFPLARWELPPWLDSEPLVAPATARWHGELWGETRDWLVRVVKDKWWAYPFVCAEESLEKAKWPLRWMSLRNIEGPEDLAAAMNIHIQKRNFSRERMFHPSGEFPTWTLKLSDSGEKMLYFSGGNESVGEEIEVEAPLNLNWPFDFVSANAAQIENEVMCAWNDGASDLHFARRWLFMSDEERYRCLIRWKHGDGPQFKSAVQQVFRVFAPLLKGRRIEWACEPSGNCFEDSDFLNDSFSSQVDEPFALLLWVQALVEVFGPRVDEELSSQHRCTREGEWWMGDYFFVSDQQPTFHEQLEAARALSEWLDERDARGELEADTLAALRETLR